MVDCYCMLTDQKRNDADEDDRRARVLAARYRQSKHYRKWDRLGRLQSFKFKTSVAATKIIFDCFGMVAFSATIFGLAVAAHISQPMNELCERPLTWQFVVLAVLGLVTGAMAFRPIGYLATTAIAACQKSCLAPFHRRLLGQPRPGIIVVRIAVVAAYISVFTLAYTVGDQLVSRSPAITCAKPAG